MSIVSIPRVLRDAKRRFCKHSILPAKCDCQGCALKPLFTPTLEELIYLHNRTKKVTFRVTETEKAHLKSEADKAGIHVEPFLRCLVLGVDLRPRPPAELAEILRQLTAIGNNINQIARVANGSGKVHQADLEYIKTMQSMIWQKIKSL